ncbi:MAG: 3-deoxy-manno-octulosonate-8-phosphatase KdsC [Gammaproteobacteria bacterium]|nr:3-deoxy-manno-octulosonate-8-phosphatase KdsC [Gammaproteobacteria bacterium]MDE1887777.1 3-deoxy-manno-octulosonate-8-phosphatase KdsC [Gammaproteobacteria bacterium]MDE2022585.1 3-deoxy-manno-octulosonate-8-phosphatase KdsC [Gammaproteobacteria bacterium]
MPALEERAARVQLAVFDVDGVFTDGRLYYGARGEQLKAFHVRDGHGIRLLLHHGMRVAVISGRRSPAVAQRMRELGIRHLFQGRDDKLAVLQKLLQRLELAWNQVACVGDDLVDLPLFEVAGLAVAVADAQPEVRARAHHVTRARGGEGAVREVCDLLLAARNTQA